MTELEAACLTVIRIEGPISGKIVAKELRRDRKDVQEAMKMLIEAGLISMVDGPGIRWDVTEKGRARFIRLVRKKVAVGPPQPLPEQLQRRARILE